MGSLAYIALVLALAVGIYLLIRYQRERQKELYRMEALRDSRLYKDIYPLILRAAARDWLVPAVRAAAARAAARVVAAAAPAGVVAAPAAPARRVRWARAGPGAAGRPGCRPPGPPAGSAPWSW